MKLIGTSTYGGPSTKAFDPVEKLLRGPVLWSVNLVNMKACYADDAFALDANEMSLSTQGLSTLLKAVHPHERDDLAADFQNALVHMRPLCKAIRVMQPSGNIRHVSMQARFTTNDKQEIVVHGSFQCIDDLVKQHGNEKERVETMEAVIEDHPQMLIAVDNDLHITLWNKQAQYRFMRYREMVTGRRIHEVIPQFADGYALQFLHQALATGQTLNVTLSSERGEMPFSLHPFKDYLGNTKGLIITAIAITVPLLNAAVNVL